MQGGYCSGPSKGAKGKSGLRCNLQQLDSALKAKPHEVAAGAQANASLHCMQEQQTAARLHHAQVSLGAKTAQAGYCVQADIELHRAQVAPT